MVRPFSPARAFAPSIPAAYAAALVLLCGATLAVWLLLGRQRADEQWVRHTDAVLMRLDGLLADIVDSETAERGFVISGQESFLQPYEEAKQRLARDVFELDELTRDNQAQQARLPALASVARAELAAFERVIALRLSDAEEARAAVAAGGDKILTDKVREQIGEMKREELHLLERRQWTAAATNRRTAVIVLAVLGTMMLGLAWAAWTTQLSVARRQLAEEEAARLEATVELQRERGERDRFREQFLGIVGHDLKSPINAISIEAQVLRRYGDDADRRETAERILGSAARMTRMVDQLLDVTRSRLGGGLSIVRREVDLRALIEIVMREDARTHPGRLVIAPGGPVLGEFDPDRMSQVVSNLVGNAVKHGEGLVSVALTTSASEAILVVRNGGEPIAAEDLDHIFEPFRRGRGESDGLGLGLFIIAEVIRGHDGRIEVSSTREQGTTFTVRLPLARRSS